MPKRIQRRRTKGWRMSEGAVYVGRPTRWGNPFRVGQWVRPLGGLPVEIKDAALALGLFRANALDPMGGVVFRENVRKHLRGKDLACWCKITSGGEYIPCHADVLLEIANR